MLGLLSCYDSIWLCKSWLEIFGSALKSISRNDTLPVDVALLGYIKATELLSLRFCKLTFSIQYRARFSSRNPPWLDAPSVSLEARPETRTDDSVLRTSSFGGSSSSRPSAYRVSNPRMESEGRKTYQTMSTWCIIHPYPVWAVVS